MQKTKKRLAVVAAGTAVLTSAGIAGAYWTSSGGGSGTGSTGSTTANSIHVFDETAPQGASASAAVPLAAFFPGDSAQTVSGTVWNKEDKASVHVDSVTVSLSTDSPGGAIGQDAQACDPTNYTLAAGANVVTRTPAVLDSSNKVTTPAVNKVTVPLGASGVELTADGLSTTPGDPDASDSAPFSYSVHFNDKATTNQDSCKGAAVTLTYTANAS